MIKAIKSKSGYTARGHNLNFYVGGKVFFLPTFLIKKVQFMPVLSIFSKSHLEI